MRLSGYLAAIFDLCKLGGFPTGDEFSTFQSMLLHTFTNILVKKFLGNDLVCTFSYLSLTNGKAKIIPRWLT